MGAQRSTRLVPAALLVAIAGTATARAGDRVDFNRDVRPILSDKCFACHGPDQPRRKAGLRLDTREGAYAEAESGSPAVVPGKLEESELYARISSQDDLDRMPPPKSGKALRPAEV